MAFARLSMCAGTRGPPFARADIGPPSGMLYRVFGVVPFATLLLVAACDVVPATNPFDPATDPAAQAPASVSGRIILDDALTARATLAEQLERIEVGIVDASGEAVVGADGAALIAALDVDDDLQNVAAFSLPGLVPGRYRLIIDNVPSRFSPLSLAPFTVGAGDEFDVGALTFSLAAVDGGGPGTISGQARLEGGVGGPRRIDLYTLAGDRPVLLSSRISTDDGSFSF
jgi:hypothetical protein